MDDKPSLDDSEVSHPLVGNPLYRRPLQELCRKEKAIRISSESPTDQYRRYGKSTWNAVMELYHWLLHR